jgi:predicted choloylglycine hydrolase
MNTRPVQYSFVTLSGSDYEIGQAQAAAIREIPGWLEFLRSAPQVFDRQTLQTLQSVYRRHCPGLVEEIAGLADGLQLPPERIMYYAATTLQTGHCAQIAVLPQVSADGHTRVARSYEFSDSQDDFRLCLTRPTGRYAHLGSSTLLFGRGDGLNEHGLCVTMTAGGIPMGNNPGQPKPVEDGLQFWAAVRALLENCRTVDEALAWLAEFPLGTNTIFLLTDRTGQTARVEAFGSKRAITRRGPGSAEGYLFTTNHYLSPEMQPYNGKVMNNSAIRGARIASTLAAQAPHIRAENLQGLLSERYPDGLCCHYYDAFFGTLRSMLFDLTRAEVEICFGSPQANPWHTFRFDGMPPFAVYEVSLPKETAAPDFFFSN